MKKVSIPIHWLFFFLGAFLSMVIVILSANSKIINFGQENRNKVDSLYRDYQVHQNVINVVVPENLSFAGEKVPLNDREVYERLERELFVNTYFHSNTILTIKLANRYFPVIEPILAANGIPDDFKYLAVAESGLRNVVSPAGAAGFWQIMKTTGAGYGLEINGNVDERYHLEKATGAACQYLLEAKDKFGSWTDAAASYNMGMAGFSREASDQLSNYYYDLYLNSETSRYVFRILALKLILENPSKYGYNFEGDELYQVEEYAVVHVDTSITSLSSFAQTFGTNYKYIRLYNPWLRGDGLSNKSGKQYEIRIPN